MKELFILLFITVFFNSYSFADKDMKIGFKGKPNEVSRIIKVKMFDNYYKPNSFSIEAGETIKFEVENLGYLFMNLILQIK